MTVKELIKNLQAMPQELEVIYSIDDEGNAFRKINFMPSVGCFEDNEFESDIPKIKYNAVCVN